ncbi:MAG: hydrogen peroxide-inducible genes activator [Polyangiaceae bacterium]|nr:hydrogen peroxide-inducible genes activator [Myxococcales bacterium]MCB9587831.1 hydrogen peroxide-inducible genes activator [Polyangiaceae bacterium]MCB9608780.1 hydrogen peroxide-inducible genes activator [Polyangiaceae bacterium]
MNLSALTIQQLRYLVAVDQHRNFREAAAACHVSQPALSTQLKRLEELLETTLYDRSKQPIVPTPLGALVVAQAKVVLEQVDRLGALARPELELSGVYRLGVIPTLTASFLPLFIPQFSVAYPKVELIIKELPTDQLIRGLRAGTLDAGLAATPLEVPGLFERPLCNEPFYVFVPPGHALGKRTELHQSDLVGEHLWLLAEGHCFRNQVLHLCSADLGDSNDGRKLQLETGSFEALVRLVQAGLGVTILPELTTRQLSDAQRQQQVRPFVAPVPVRQVGLLYAREHIHKEITDAIARALLSGIPAELREPNSDQAEPLPPKNGVAAATGGSAEDANGVAVRRGRRATASKQKSRRGSRAG